MKKRDYYITKSGCLKRKENTIYFENDKIKKAIPVNRIDAIYVYGELDINKRLLVYLCQKNIPIHFFNYYGYYSGSFYPRDYVLSGDLLVKQVENYLNHKDRLSIAEEFIRGAIANILKNLEYYKVRGKSVKNYILEIKKISFKINNVGSVPELMGLEGNIRSVYYKSFNEFLRKPFRISKRVKRPPDNMLNCLISFGNSLMYRTVLTEIYRTQLNPTISYLHKPRERRFSLSLDISEVFKPIIVDKLIFNLVNNRILQKEDFLEKVKFCHLNDKGKKKFLREYDKMLRRTVQHPVLNREVSYKRLIRLECYKLIKHLLGDKDYKALKRWW